MKSLYEELLLSFLLLLLLSFPSFNNFKIQVDETELTFLSLRFHFFEGLSPLNISLLMEYVGNFVFFSCWLYQTSRFQSIFLLSICATSVCPLDACFSMKTHRSTHSYKGRGDTRHEHQEAGMGGAYPPFCWINTYLISPTPSQAQ